MRQPGEPQFELPPETVVFGTSEAMKKVQRDLSMIASADVPVLIQGPSGTGKEIIAKIIHRTSPFARGPFIKVNCPAIPDALLESELFGYEKGAFTGANTAKPGLIAMANRGTLFLDEIGELSMQLQSKLLQVLQDGKFCRIGAQEETRSEARVICTSSRDLKHEIEAGNFREDLYYRINVVNIGLPSLRERNADVPALAEYFREHFNMVYNRRTPPISSSLMKLLQAYHWPGNIRQLENMMKRYVILGTENCITTDLTEPVPSSFELDIPEEGPVPLKKVTQQAVRRLERQIILKVLQNTHWNRRRAAELLKISYRALLYKIRDAGLSPNRPAAKPDNVHPISAGNAQAESHEVEDGDESFQLMPVAKGNHA
ncbi:MAG TPA: sigma 54-interacting transcriptional regulator [Candidatus Angelobacter sp.]|jgi:two-component system response regulator AtoC|nr:sigma 54-interacting transcriptional regulator [Candidatus Angelobacter sp.]